MKKLKLFFACLLMAVLSIGQVWGADPAPVGTTLFSEDFSGYAKDAVPSGEVTTATGRVVYGGANVTYSVTNGSGTTKIYTENTAGGTSPEILVGKSNGTLTIAGIPSGGAKAITVSYKQNKQKLKVESTTTGYSGSKDEKPSSVGANSVDITIADGSAETFTLVFTGSGTSNVRVDDILVTVKTAGEGAGTPTCATPTFDPAEGTFYGSQEIAIATGTEGASIYYTTDGTTPSSTNGTLYEDPFEITATTTIKAIAVKDGANNSEVVSATYTAGEVVTSYSIDFETNNLAAYVNWNFENIVCASTAITAHGGTYYGNTNAKSTASITTKAKYANPGMLTFYISKESGNTSASSWYAQVSEDGEEWTNVETFDAKGMGKGEWNECTADLSSYSNVYVRISYGSSTAIRAIDDIELAAASATPKAAKPTFETGDDFVTSTSVTLACATEGASIYYTTNGDVPTSGSTLYEGAIPVSTTTTIKAIAIADGYDASPVAEKTFTKVEALESLAALLEATTSTETAFNVVISNWVVTGVNGTRAWIADAANEKGILLYKSGHNFVAGNKLNGVVIGTKTKLYQGYPELTSLVSTDVTVTTAETVTPRTTTIAALTSGHPNEQGTVVKLEGVTYESSALSDGVNSIAADNKLFSSLALVDGTTYDITGVVEYLNEGVVKIMPRSADDVEAKSAVVVPTAANLAALKAAERGTYILTLTNAVVTYVNGNNAFIEDATGGALIYFASHGYSAGDCLNGDYQVVTTDYQGKFEITAMEPQAGAATTTAEIPLTTVTIATLNASFSSYESRRVKIVGANVTDAISGGDRNGAINDGAALAVYAAVASTITLTADDNVDIIGYPGFHNTDQQLTVWAQADITVNEKEDPELAYDPVSETIEQGASWSAPTLTNPHSLTISSYASNNESVATVSDEGVIALAGGLGTAVITAHTDGDATYAAGNATYTITVNEAGVYSMSFDMTRASYDAAADAQVVWNSSVVTMTVDKGTSSTKANNYIGGGYNGTTLCADSRFYPGSIITFAPASGVTITKVEWTATSNSYASNFVSAEWTNATAAAEGSVVTITPVAAGDFSATIAASKQARATGITVYYTAESEKAKLVGSISIDNINTAVGEDDIVLLDIAATSNPNKNAISYAIESGSEYVSIVGEGKAAAFHAIAEGTATISATIPNDLGNYTGASTTFNIVVAAAPATLESIAISGEASVLEYTAGQHFNPAGLVVTGTYSDASTAPITEGIDWTFAPDPLTEGTTSVSVTATVSEISSSAFVVNGLTVSAAAAPTVDNVVILAVYDTKYYAMSTTNANNGFTAIAVEYDGTQVTVESEAEKTAIQWTRTTTGDNTTFQDADSKYMKSADGASMSLETSVCNWLWDATEAYYKISGTSRTFFFQNTSGGIFKNYAVSNIGGTGYSGKAQVIVIDPANIVVTSKVDPALAYTPASDEITVGDAWSAPVLGYVEGFDGLAAITYESNNEAVATVTDAGVIALAGGTGTATITATFAGNASYLAGSATYTVKVNEPAEDCDGSDDFSTATNTSASSYNVERTTTNGWSSVNSALTTINSEARWLTMLGKTSQVGVITSPTLNDGIASLKIRYANTFNESNGVSFRVDIKQGEDIVKTYTITKENSEVEKGTVYTEIIENINVAGDFQMIFTNLCPSNADSNKDRVSIGKLCWKGYAAPEPPTPVYETVRSGLTAGNYYTVCWPKKMKDIKGGTLWSFAGKDAAMAYLIQEDAPFVAGRPYIIYATADKLEAVVEGDDAVAGSNNGLHGTLVDMTNSELLAAGATYMLKGNALRPVGGGHLDANRAYVILEEITDGAPAANVPAHKVRKMPLQDQTTTDCEFINAAEAPAKMMINGQLFILRGEKMYDATGRLVK